MLSAPQDILLQLTNLNDPAYVKFYPKLIQDLSEALSSAELCILIQNLLEIELKTEDKLTRKSFSHALFTAIISPFSRIKRDLPLETMQSTVLEPMYTSFLDGQSEGDYEQDDIFIEVLEELIEVDPILDATLVSRELTEKTEERQMLSQEAFAKIAILLESWSTVIPLRKQVNQLNPILDEILVGNGPVETVKKQLSVLDELKDRLLEAKKILQKKLTAKKTQEGKTEKSEIFYPTLIRKMAEKFGVDGITDFATAFLKQPLGNIDEPISTGPFFHALFTAILNPKSHAFKRDQETIKSMQEDLLSPFYTDFLSQKVKGHYVGLDFRNFLEKKIELNPLLRGLIRQIHLVEMDWPEFDRDFLADCVAFYQNSVRDLRLLQTRVNELNEIWQHCASPFDKNSQRHKQYVKPKEEITSAFNSVLNDEGDLEDLIVNANQKITDAVSHHLNVSVAGETLLQRLEKLKLPNFALLENRIKSEPGFKTEISQPKSSQFNSLSLLLEAPKLLINMFRPTLRKPSAVPQEPKLRKVSIPSI